MNHYAILITLSIYMAIVIVMAIVAYRYTTNIRDFVLAGRNLNAWLTALGAGASDMSSWLLMALPGLIFVQGIQVIWLPISLIIGAYCNWRFIAKRLRSYTFLVGDVLTIPAFFQQRFVSHALYVRLITSVMMAIFFIFYASAGFISGAVVLQEIFHISYKTGLMISAVVIISYMVVGGFWAISWLDLFQGALMLFALIIIPIVTSNASGGWIKIYNSLHHADKLLFIKDLNIWGILALVAWGFGYFGQPHIQARFMASKNLHALILARRICMSWMTMALIGAVLVGLVGSIIYATTPLAKPETVLLQLSYRFFNPWVCGILLSAVLSTIMGSVAAQLIMTATIIIEDLYELILKQQPNRKTNLTVSRVVLILISLLSVYIARDESSSLMGVVSFAWAGLGAAIGPSLLMSLYWRRMTATGAFWGIFAGGITVIVVRVLLNFYVSDNAFTTLELLPGFFVGILAIIIGSLLTRPNHQALEGFDRMLQSLSNAR